MIREVRWKNVGDERGKTGHGDVARASRRWRPHVTGKMPVPQAKFTESFAADLDADKAAFMADSQVPWGVNALTGAISQPAWKTRPSWYLVATDDRMIPPAAQRFMAERANSKVVEASGSHAIYLSQPDAVAWLIETAASELVPDKLGVGAG